jgi:glycine/D-amino acid oxidase-like deaminating enzyme
MQRALLLSYTKSFEDIAVYDERAFLAHVGMTIFCKPYLETLWLDAQSQGVKLVIKKIMGVEELVGYDRIVLAAGEGIFAFPQVSGLRLEPLKGQILRCAVPEGTHLPEQSMIGKGYIAHVGEERACFIGSTYERGEFSPLPDLPKAYEDLLPKVSAFYPQAARFIVTECRAAFRVMRIGHYFPMAGRLKENIWLCTALGSRGLLYHGLLGERMSQALLCDDPSLLPQEFSVYTKT